MSSSAPWASRLAIVVCFLIVIMMVLAGAIAILLEAQKPYPDASPLADTLVFPLVGLMYPAVGGLIAIKRPGNLVGWALLLSSVSVIVEPLMLGYAELALLAKPEADLPGGMVAFVIGSGTWTALMAGVFLLFLFFPSGVMPSLRWRAISSLVLLGFALIWLMVITSPVVDPPFQDRHNPLALTEGEGYLEILSLLLVPPCVLAVVVAAINLIARFRRSTGEEREQFKWLGFAAGFLLLTLPPAIFDNWKGLPSAPFIVALMALPVSVGIAVLKYRLYEIDLIINRTLVYVPLTAILAGMFVALTTLARTAFTDLTQAGSDASIAASTIAVVALLTPLKNKLQALVDKHFKDMGDRGRDLRLLTSETRTVVQVLDTGKLLERFLAATTRALDANAAAIELTSGPSVRVVASAAWNGDSRLTLPLHDNGDQLGYLKIGPSRRGAAYREDETHDVKDAMEVLALALKLDQEYVGHAPAYARRVLSSGDSDQGQFGVGVIGD